MHLTCLTRQPKLVPTNALLLLLLAAFVCIGERCVNASTMDKWLELGKDIGLTGQGLLDFVREREAIAREERVKMLELRRYEKEIVETQLQVKQLEAQTGQVHVSNTSEDKKPKNVCRTPKLPIFHDEKDDLEAYIHRFERYASAAG